MTEIHELICIACPVGCQIKAQVRQDKIISIEGNQCKRGAKSIPKTKFSDRRGWLPVRYECKMRLCQWFRCEQLSRCLKKSIGGAILQELAQVTVIAPIEFHQTIAHDIAGTGGVAVVASRPLPVREAKDKTA